MSYKLSPEELEIENNIEQFVEIDDSEKNKLKNLVTKTKEKKTITLRLNNNDLEKIKLEASKNGLPYQTFISSILHKYITNQLVDEKVFQKFKELVVQ